MKVKIIEKLRHWKGLKAADVAAQLGLSERQYRRYEQGESDWTLELLDQMSGILKMSVPEMLSFDEKVFFAHCNQANTYSSHNVYNETSEKERELYEARIKELQEEVTHLRKNEDFLRKQLEQALSR